MANKKLPQIDIIIPASIILAGLSFSFWIGTVSSKTDDNSVKIKEQKEASEHVLDHIIEIKTDIGLIKGILDERR